MIGLVAAAAVSAAALPACTPARLSIAVDGLGGAFDGMSHAGTLLVLRNLGPGACTIALHPFIGFLDGDGRPMPITARITPVVRATTPPRRIGIAAEAEVTTPLRWVSGPVYPRSRCLTPATLSVAIGGTLLRTPLPARMCGPAGAPVTIDQPPLRTDPVLP